MTNYQYGDPVRILKGRYIGLIGTISKLPLDHPYYEIVIHDSELGGPTGTLLKFNEFEKVTKCEDPNQLSLF